MEQVIDFVGSIGNFMWGPWTFFVLMGAGILFTVWTRFVQFKALTHGVAVIRGKYDRPDDPGAINHFQALSAALSATVGLGNIGGVALAIAGGGPGALFWMWVIGFFGMALKTVEVSLAMLYRDTSDPDNPHGGAMWVIDRTLGAKGGVFKGLAKILGATFCITLIISTITGGNMFQSWNVADLTKTYFNVPPLVTGILLAAIVGAVIVGGIKRIGTVAGKLVPFMCVLYLLAAFAVLFNHLGEIPALLLEVVTSAFSPEEATGAFLGGSMGWAFSTGLRRALFSNEAGQGSAPIAHAAAKTDEPVREGIVSGLEPFIDTICICTLTALVILSTGTWNRDALGEFTAPIRVEQVGSDWVVNVTVPDGLKDVRDLLPARADDRDWRDRDGFFLLGQAEGATHTKKGADRVRIKAELKAKSKQKPGEEQDTTGPNMTIGADNDHYLTWKVDFDDDPGDWTGTITAINLVDAGLYQDFNGATLTGYAFDREFPGLGKYLVTLAAWLFAISTMISWSYYGEQGVIYLAGRYLVLPYKVLFLLLVIVGAVAINETSDMEKLMDLGTGAMLWANMPIVLLMGFIAVRELDSYFKRLKAGEFSRLD